MSGREKMPPMGSGSKRDHERERHERTAPAPSRSELDDTIDRLRFRPQALEHWLETQQRWPRLQVRSALCRRLGVQRAKELWQSTMGVEPGEWPGGGFAAPVHDAAAQLSARVYAPVGGPLAGEQVFTSRDREPISYASFVRRDRQAEAALADDSEDAPLQQASLHVLFASQGMDSGEPLPVALLTKMNALFRRDFSAVRVHHDAAAAAAAERLGVSAFLVRGHLYFAAGRFDPSSAEGERLIVHELTHITEVEERSGLAARARHPAPPAHAATAGAVAGARTHVDGNETARHGGAMNPRPLTDDLGRRTIEHRLPTLDEGYGFVPEPQSAPTAPTGPMQVRILHDLAHPLGLSGLPREQDLFEPVQGNEQGALVLRRTGDLQTPLVEAAIDPESLFIGGGPADQDVQQGQFGTCYFLAVVEQIVQRDPEKIRSLISLTGDTVTAHFFRYEVDHKRYLPVTIQTDRTLAHSRGEGSSLAGAGLHIGPAVTRSDWYAHVVNQTLCLIRRDYHEAAQWAPLLEKAYALFAEQYGQYGGGTLSLGETENNQFDGSGAKRSGYAITDGGFDHDVYQCLYGSSMKSHGLISTKFSPAHNAILDNKKAMETLFRLQGQEHRRRQDLMITASSDYRVLFRRILDLIEVTIASHKNHCPQELISSLTFLSVRIKQWNQLERLLHATHATMQDRANETDAKTKIIHIAQKIAAPESWPTLHRQTAPSDLRALLEVLADITNAGSDESVGQRFIYSEHAYSVISISLRDREGHTVIVSAKYLENELERIDAERSQVVLRNPHRTNEPDPHGLKRPDDGSGDDGLFTLSLMQFLRNCSQIDFAKWND